MARFAWSLVFCPQVREKINQDGAEDQHGALIVYGGQPGFDPGTNCILVDAQQT
jgi:hypothetical protein